MFKPTVLTVNTVESGRASACKLTHTVDTRSAVRTRVASTLVNIYRTQQTQYTCGFLDSPDEILVGKLMSMPNYFKI